MNDAPLIVALPTADRQVAYAFYKDGLGFEPIGELADDGVAALQFVLNDGARLMFIPTGGFGWVTGDHETAPPGTSEVLLSRGAGELGGGRRRHRARPGRRCSISAQQQPWGYTGTFADPDHHLWEVISVA